MTMAGGATDGYWAIGNCVIATPPITRMNSAITHAKMGRLMKNWAMTARPSAAGGRAGGPGGRCRTRRLPRHRLHRRIATQFLEAVDHHQFARLQAIEHDPLPIARR